MIQAIKYYIEATGANLADAKRAVEEMAMDESVRPPVSKMDMDNPILDARIRSLLSRGQKIEAVKIYQQEYGIGLKDSKNAVERIQAGMKRDGSSFEISTQSAIGADPFAQNNGNPQWMIAMVLGITILLIGIGILVLFLGQ